MIVSDPFQPGDGGAAREDSSRISAEARIMPGAFVGEGVTIGPGAVIGPNACVLGSDVESDQQSVIGEFATVGGNATVHPGVHIGARARVSPGAVVARSVPPFAIVEGNPARIVGYVDATADAIQRNGKEFGQAPGVRTGRVKGVTLHRFLSVSDLRGNLSAGEFGPEIPFTPLRYFLVFDVPTAETRGEHAHLECEQFLVAVAGSVSVVIDDGIQREEYTLDRPDLGLYLPPMTWGIQYRYTTDAILLVFASHYYNAADYVRDYSRFLELVSNRKAP